MAFQFTQLHVYQKALVFVSQMFLLTKTWPALYRFNLTEQLHRAALSIALNIAEGSGRTGKDFQNFLRIARGSCFECVAILTIAAKESLLTQQELNEVTEQLDHIARMLTSLRSKVGSVQLRP